MRSRNMDSDAEVVTCLTDAGWEADILILTVPIPAENEIADKIMEVANQKIVISHSEKSILYRSKNQFHKPLTGLHLTK